MNTYGTDALWHEMHGALKGFIAKRVPDETTADDILQDVFMRIHAHAESVKDAAKLESWVYQITRNAVVDYYRSQKHEYEVSETLLVVLRSFVWRTAILLLGIFLAAMTIPLHILMLRRHPHELGLLPDGLDRQSTDRAPVRRVVSFRRAIQGHVFWLLTKDTV